MENQLDKKLIEKFLTNSTELSSIQQKITEAVKTLSQDLEKRQKVDEELREAIKNAMRENDVKKFENDLLSLTYIEPSQRKSVDTPRLKAEKPEIWEEYMKVIEVKDSIRIKIK